MKTFLPQEHRKNQIIFYLPKNTEKIIFYVKTRMKVKLSLDGIKEGKLQLLNGINFVCNCSFYSLQQQWYTNRYKTYVSRSIKGTYLGPKPMRILTFEVPNSPNVRIVYIDEITNGIDLKTWSILSSLKMQKFNYNNKERKAFPVPIKKLYERVFTHSGSIFAFSYIPYHKRISHAPRMAYSGKYEYSCRTTCLNNCGTKGAILKYFHYGATF